MDRCMGLCLSHCPVFGDHRLLHSSGIVVRRAKAPFFSGCESHPATIAPAGSNWSSRGGNEAAEASGVEGSLRNLASMQAVT